jgi:hypothetical protein
MKKTLSVLLALVMLAALGLGVLPAASAAGDMTYALVLSASNTSVKVGDTVTVSLALSRTDANADYLLYSMQDEIQYDGRYFGLVAGSVSLGDPTFDVSTRSVGDGVHEKVIVSVVEFSGTGAPKTGAFTICPVPQPAQRPGCLRVNRQLRQYDRDGRHVRRRTGHAIGRR